MEKEIMQKLTAIENILNQKRPVFINQKQIKEKYDINRGTIWRWKENGLISGYRVGGKVFYKETEIINLIENGKEPLKARA